jgi:uncharacterized alpha-E superfamily protein
MPRSLVFSYQWINTALEGLAEFYDRRYDCHDQAAQIYARLHHGNMDDIFQQGLHEFLQEFLKSNAELSQSIARTYNFP